MSDALDIDKLELYAQCQQTDVEDVLTLVAEVRRLRALLTEMRESRDYIDSGAQELAAENDRLRALLTAEPTNDEIDAGARVLYEKGVSGRGLSLSWDDVSGVHGRGWYTERATEMLQGFLAARARKIGDSDE